MTIAPLRLSQLRFNPIVTPPEAVVLPAKATSSISLTLETTSEQVGFVQLNLPSLRAFIDGESSFCAALRDSLFTRTLSAFVEIGQSGRWIAISKIPLKEVGFDEADALIPPVARSHPAYRLLTEYFAFPEKFNFLIWI